MKETILTKRILCYVLAILTLSTSFSVFNSNTQNVFAKGSRVLETYKDAKKDAIKQYGGKDAKVTSTNPFNKMNTYNVDQDTVNGLCESNKHLWGINNNLATGTCSEVAMGSFMEYLNRKGIVKFKKNKNKKATDIACMCVVYGIKNKLMSKYTGKKAGIKWDGTKASNVEKIMFGVYNQLGISYSPVDLYETGLLRNTNMLNNTVKYEINRWRPVIGHFTLSDGNHSMVINGIYYITVKAPKKKAKTYQYYIVNDGWHDSNSWDADARIQYIRTDYIHAVNITTS